jgi:hypothetical protein
MEGGSVDLQTPCPLSFTHSPLDLAALLDSLFRIAYHTRVSLFGRLGMFLLRVLYRENVGEAR